MDTLFSAKCPHCGGGNITLVEPDDAMHYHCNECGQTILRPDLVLEPLKRGEGKNANSSKSNPE